MEYTQTGIILCAENYSACVDFYSITMALPILEVLDNQHSQLTKLKFGEGVYLMLERDGIANPCGKSLNENPVWMRFNVRNVEQAAEELRRKGVSVNIRREVWGTVGDFWDPDGNCCSLREEPGSN